MKAAADMGPRFVFKRRSGKIWEYGSALPDGSIDGIIEIIRIDFLDGVR